MVRITAKQYEEILARHRGARPPEAPSAVLRNKASKRLITQPGPPSIPERPAVAPLLTGLSDVGRVRTILMPYAEEMLTSNQRLHHMAEYKIKKRLRADATQMIALERLPRLKRAAIFYVLHPRSINRKRDPGNWAPTAKAYVDGLVTPNPHRPREHHLLPDDDHEHLLGPNPVMGAPVSTGFARMSLVIVELAGPVTIGNGETVTGSGSWTYST